MEVNILDHLPGKRDEPGNVRKELDIETGTGVGEATSLRTEKEIRREERTRSAPDNGTGRMEPIARTYVVNGEWRTRVSAEKLDSFESVRFAVELTHRNKSRFLRQHLLEYCEWLPYHTLQKFFRNLTEEEFEKILLRDEKQGLKGT